MTNKYTISVVANVTISVEIEAESTSKAKEVVDAMQHDELEQKPFRIYSIEEIDVDSDIKLLESGGHKSIIEKGVTIAWDAMEIARIGKDQLYAKAEETFMGAFGIEIEIFDMTITPESIEDNEVLWVCVPTDYKIEDGDVK